GAGRRGGLRALAGQPVDHSEREPLLLFANQIALAVERAQLREQALRAALTEEVARLAKTLVAAVAHDLRSPLASIKASSSTLSDPQIELAPSARPALAGLVDAQGDRLTALVQNLLDMSRIQAGVLEPRRSVTSVGAIAASVLADLGPAARDYQVDIQIPDDLPPVDVDVVLISRVLSNLTENAVRH